MILKTCGQTRLLDAVPAFLDAAERFGGLGVVSNIYYSRKNFLRPAEQPAPHQRFEDEIEQLSALFPDGEAFCMGPLTSADRWYLFVAYGSNAGDSTPAIVDHTLEARSYCVA